MAFAEKERKKEKHNNNCTLIFRDKSYPQTEGLSALQSVHCLVHPRAEKLIDKVANTAFLSLGIRGKPGFAQESGGISVLRLHLGYKRHHFAS